MNSIQIAHSKDLALTDEQVELGKQILGHVADWFQFPGFGAGFVIHGDLVVNNQPESVRIAINTRQDHTFELQIQRPGTRDLAMTTWTGAAWLSTRWFIEQITELPD